MAIATKITRPVSEITGIPQSTVDTIVRRLGEAGRVPRGSRGRRPADLGSEDFAHILLGVFCVADGIGGSATRVAQEVDWVGRLKCGGSLEWTPEDDLSIATLVVPGGSFLDQIAYLFDQCADPNTAPVFEEIVLAVGLSRSEAQTVGWVDVTGDGEVMKGGAVHCTITLGGVQRVFFGDIDPMSLRGMIREARMRIGTLAALARLALVDPPNQRVSSGDRDR